MEVDEGLSFNQEGKLLSWMVELRLGLKYKTRNSTMKCSEDVSTAEHDVNGTNNDLYLFS